MSIGEFEFQLKVIVFVSASVAFVFAAAILFSFERFQFFNEKVNTRYLKSDKKGGFGKKYLIDNWIMEWRMGIGVLVLLVSTWLFWICFR